MKRYNPKDIEPKWQKIWSESKLFEVTEDSDKPKKYIIDMFPYPSGAAMHVGHIRNFTISDVLSQYHRQKGYNVMHTMGWDTFGSPAENFAIKTGITPQESTKTNIANFKHQLNQLGISYDWSREINTTDPKYYKWTQWIFIQLFNKGLAYQKESMQWWCNECKTVLANEQVINGCCWRHEDSPVIKKKTKQWFFKITEYAEQLLEGIDTLDWPEKIKLMQKNWIGKSIGAEVSFQVKGKNEKIKIFTTRPDTIFGANFVVLAPEHYLVNEITTNEQKNKVDDYVNLTLKKSDVQRQQDADKEKTGVFTGSYAINPANDQEIPIWISDYVLTGYGTGAIMAVPAHDERDFQFASKFNLPITPVIIPEKASYLIVEKSLPKDTIDRLTEYGEIETEKSTDEWGDLFRVNVDIDKEDNFRRLIATNILDKSDGAWYADSMGTSNWVIFKNQSIQITDQKDYDKFTDIANELGIPGEQLDIKWPAVWTGEGRLRNSNKYNGHSSQDAREKIVSDLLKDDKAYEKVNYKMRDWLISRQRYWGAPIPIIHCEIDGAVAVPENELPIELPIVDSFAPTGDGISVLASEDEWVNVKCPKCGKDAKRETDTMDGYACSSWYYLRYADPNNDKQAWSPSKANYWLPIDYYCGGDHAVSHLLYSRFWMHFFADQGWIEQTKKEPVGKLVYNGYILAHDGNKMSKSKGNVVNPDDLIEQGYGADSLRLFEMFIAPYDQATSWNTNGVPGTYRFLQRFWTLVQEYLEQKQPSNNSENNKDLQIIKHKTIKKVSECLDGLLFNTAVASLMDAVNQLYKIKAEDKYKSNEWSDVLSAICQLLAPFSPHISEELWQQLGNNGSVHFASWPVHKEELLISETITIIVQVNGKLRAQLNLPADSTKEDIILAAKANDHVKTFLKNEIKKEIFIPNKLINFVV